MKNEKLMVGTLGGKPLQTVGKQPFCMPAGDRGGRPYMVLAIGMQECNML
ncbi:MAG: hypothetical protein LBD16_09100 [Oscillospiraceae bacterium]|jgi:hypothetical protein|nr:hypothetical protein [Oscillospiraceae bacterium]